MLFCGLLHVHIPKIYNFHPRWIYSCCSTNSLISHFIQTMSTNPCHRRAPFLRSLTIPTTCRHHDTSPFHLSLAALCAFRFHLAVRLHHSTAVYCSCSDSNALLVPRTWWRYDIKTASMTLSIALLCAYLAFASKCHPFQSLCMSAVVDDLRSYQRPYHLSVFSFNFSHVLVFSFSARLVFVWKCLSASCNHREN